VQLGFVGLGAMGGALARRLMLKNKLAVHDLRAQVVADFASKGGIAAKTPGAMAAECDLVMTCLPTSNEVRAAIFGPDGLAAGMKRGGIIADMTTGDPNATRAMAAELKEKGITLIDAPVSGGPHGADAGTIAIMIGAPADLYDRVKPLFEMISPNVFHCGDVGAGHVMKLVNNVIAASVRAVTFEAVAMGVKNGLTIDKCAEVLHKGSARSYSTEITLPKLAKGGDIRTNFTLALMHKDVRLATELGLSSAMPMPISNLVKEVFQTTINDQGAGEDVNMMIRTIEKLGKVKVVP
jgi:3-hydroxyisobutyrate dehydrogenase